MRWWRALFDADKEIGDGGEICEAEVESKTARFLSFLRVESKAARFSE